MPWAGSLRAAARSNAPLVPGALADAVRGVAAASSPRPPAWWRLVMLWQWLLTVLAAAAVVVAVVIAVDHLAGHHKGVISEASLIPWLLALAVALLVLGFLTAVGCRNTTVAAAEREREGGRAGDARPGLRRHPRPGPGPPPAPGCAPSTNASAAS